MGLITKEVEVNLCNRMIPYYENLGYEIPRYYYKNNGKYRVKVGSTIIVKVEDLPPYSRYRVDVECDCCGKMLNLQYAKYRNRLHNGKHYCHSCSLKVLFSGENHPKWNPDISQEEREQQRNYPEYIEFVKRVASRDNYTCQVCGKRTHKDGEVHHLNGYSWFIEGRTDETNALLLCSNCHANYHSHYGNKHSTREEFEEWLGKTVGKLEKYDGVLPIARKIYCYEENKIYDNARELKKTWGLKSDSTIYEACNRARGIRKALGKHLFWLDEYEQMTQDELNECLADIKRGRSVICITTGEIYPNITEAYRDKKMTTNKISDVCRGKAKSSGKLPDGTPLQWMYYEEYLEKIENGEQISPWKSGARKVICITTGVIFNSLTMASNEYNIKNVISICNACKGKKKSAGKLPDGTRLKWMYYEDFLALSIEEQNKILNRNKDLSNNDRSFII